MAQTKEETVAHLREILAPSTWCEITVGFERDGEPTVHYQNWGGGPRQLLDRADIERTITFLKEYLNVCPDDSEVAHNNGHFCGNYDCSLCYEREHRFLQGHFRGGSFLGDPREGFLVLYEVGGQYGLFASSHPERRLREIENKLGESVRYIHRIASNDQAYLKDLWYMNMADYLSQHWPGPFFKIPPKVERTFRLQQHQDVERSDSWAKNMGAVDMSDVSNLRAILESDLYSRRRWPDSIEGVGREVPVNDFE